MKSINSLPCEIIGHILANCESFAQLRDAIPTCKSFYSAWKSYTGSIIWHVGQSEIVGFTDALIAVRATEIAKQAILRGDLPPSPFPPGELSGAVRKPTPDELKVLMDFRQLVECLQRLVKKNIDPYWLDCIERLQPEDRIKSWMVWKERFHVATYRSFLSGAVLYRAYHEPLTLASTRGLPRLLDKYWRRGDEPEDEHIDKPKFALFHQLLQFMFITQGEMFGTIIKNEDGSCRQQRKYLRPRKEMSGRPRTVTVIFFDVLSLEEIIMPENMEDAVETFVIARPGLERAVVDGANLPGLEHVSGNILEFLWEMRWYSGQPNCYRLGCRTAPPTFQFVRYMLSKYFRLRFKDDT